MFIKLTYNFKGKTIPILINIDNVIAIEDYEIYTNERIFCVNETLKEIEDKIEQIIKGEEESWRG